MKKEEIIEKLRRAKNSDLQWIEKAKSIIKGNKNDIAIIPIDAIHSEFGKWFYSEGEQLKKLSNNPLECMKNIELLHQEFHKCYFDIYHIYYNESKKAKFFSKLMGAKRAEVDESEYNEAMSILEKMKEYAKDFISEVERLERRLEAVTQEKIDLILQKS